MTKGNHDLHITSVALTTRDIEWLKKRAKRLTKRSGRYVSVSELMREMIKEARQYS